MKILILSCVSVACEALICERPSFTQSVADMLGRAARSDSSNLESPNVLRMKRLLPENQWNLLFPLANMGEGPLIDPYKYTNFIEAASRWPSFCNDKVASSTLSLDQMCLRELASLFSQYAQEVGAHNSSQSIPEWKQGLYYYTELGCEEGTNTHCDYRGASCDDPANWAAKAWPCPDDAKYYGRGSLQISYNYNYGPFSYAMFGDSTVLLNNPERVTEDWLAFASGMCFYMTPQSPKPSMHDVVTGFWNPNAADIAAGRVTGFGALIMIINGNMECGKLTQQASDRATFYSAFLDYFNLPEENNLSCVNMEDFDGTSSAVAKGYWDQSWETDSCGNKCELVSYQTPNSIFDDPDNPDIPYSACMYRIFGEDTLVSSTENPSIGQDTFLSTSTKGETNVINNLFVMIFIIYSF